jgi:hypothetical protein
MSSAAALRDGLVRKIVKEAVGVDVVLPPRSATDEDSYVRHSADTYPLLEPYRWLLAALRLSAFDCW